MVSQKIFNEKRVEVIKVHIVVGGGGFMIMNMKCSWSAKHSRRLRLVLRLTITSCENSSGGGVLSLWYCLI